MSTVVDELVTRYSLDDKYSSKAAHIGATTQKLNQSIGQLSYSQLPGLNRGVLQVLPGLGRLEPAVVSAGSALTGLGVAAPQAALVALIVIAGEVSNAMQVIGAAAVGAKDTLLALGEMGATVFALRIAKPATDAAKTIDMFTRQFGAMLGEAAKGKQAMAWIQQYGLTSGMEQGPLMEATKMLYMQGRNPKQYLPMMETIAYGGGGDPSSNMRDLTFVLRRLMGGQIAEALGPEGLGRFGVSRNQLQTYGAKFDKQGQFLGTTQDALDVLERMVALDPRLKDLKKSMEESDAVKWSNLGDAVSYALGAVGRVVSDVLLPSVVRAGEGLTFLARSGALEQITKQLLDLFGLGGKDGLLRGVMTMYIIATDVVGVIRNMKFAVVLLAQKVGEFLGRIAKMPGMGFLTPVSAGLMNVKAGAESWSADVQKRVDELIRKMEAAGNGVALEPPMPSYVPEEGIANPQTQLLAQIADNTRKQLDLTRHALGGGELGRQGVTSVELNAMKRGSSRSRTNHGAVSAIASEINRLAHDIAADMVGGSAQSRYAHQV